MRFTSRPAVQAPATTGWLTAQQESTATKAEQAKCCRQSFTLRYQRLRLTSLDAAAAAHHATSLQKLHKRHMHTYLCTVPGVNLRSAPTT
jgi:hypothetical protein